MYFRIDWLEVKISDSMPELLNEGIDFTKHSREYG